VLKAGYLTCAVDQMGGANQLDANLAEVLTEANFAGLCDYVSVDGGETGAQRKANAVRDVEAITGAIQSGGNADTNQQIIDHWNSDGIPDYLEDQH
jgi:hypothetical protein